MKALVVYDENHYLVPAEEKEVDYDALFHLVNNGCWPDECHDKDWIIQQSKIIAYMTDESAFC